MPLRRIRCHSACWTSSVCSEASSPSVSPSPPVARVQARTSSSLGVWWPFSSFDTLDGGQDKDSASCRPLSPACWRSSRNRLPSALRASWTLDAFDVLFGGKGVPFYCPVPGSVTPIVVINDDGRIVYDLTAQEAVRVVEVHPHQLARVEQPVVVVRQTLRLGLITGEVADVLACPVGELRTPHAEAPA